MDAVCTFLSNLEFFLPPLLRSSLRWDAMQIIVRPSNVFGPEDSYLNWFGEMAAMLPYVPLVNNGETLCQPVHCSDVGRAVMSILYVSPPAVAV